MSLNLGPPKKRANRRVNRSRAGNGGGLLEVNVRRTKESFQRRRRIVNIVCRFALLVAAVVSISVGGYKAARKLWFANPEYTIRTIEVVVDGPMTREQVLEASGVGEGVNIFTVNLAKIRTQLEHLPRIQSAGAERHLPDRLTIRVSERRPAAWVAGAGPGADPFSAPGSLIVDVRGVAVPPGDMQPDYYHLPVIFGFDTTQAFPGEIIDSEPLQAALELLRLCHDPLVQTRFQITAIDISKKYCMAVTEIGHGMFTFGLDGLDEQLGRLQALLAHAENASGPQIATANLSAATQPARHIFPAPPNRLRRNRRKRPRPPPNPRPLPDLPEKPPPNPRPHSLLPSRFVVRKP